MQINLNVVKSGILKLKISSFIFRCKHKGGFAKCSLNQILNYSLTNVNLSVDAWFVFPGDAVFFGQH